MFRQELERCLLKNETIKASMDKGELDKNQLSKLINQVYEHPPALALLQRNAYGTLFNSDMNGLISKEEMIKILEGYVLTNFNSHQTKLKL